MCSSLEGFQLWLLFEATRASPGVDTGVVLWEQLCSTELRGSPASPAPQSITPGAHGWVINAVEGLQKPSPGLFLDAFTAASVAATSSESFKPVFPLGARQASHSHPAPALLSLQSCADVSQPLISPSGCGVQAVPAPQDSAR